MMSMSDKRFEKWNDHSCKVKDNQENTLLNWEDVVQKLNEQQFTIEQLQKENKQLQKELNNCEKFRYTVFKRIREIW